MSGVSDIGKYNSTQYILKILGNDLDDVQRQSSTGKKSTTMAGLGTLGAAHAISARNASSTLDSYTSNLNAAKAKLTAMDKAMQNVADTARGLLSTLRSQLQGTAPESGVLSGSAKAQLQSVLQQMNLQMNGQYLFAADDTNHAPVPNAAALNTNIGALASAWVTGGITPGAMVTAARGVSGTALGYSATLASAGNVSFRADENLDLDYTERADQSGFADVLRAMATIANLPAPTSAAEQTNYWNVVNGAIDLLDQGAKAIDTAQGVLGVTANEVDNLVSQHAETKTNLEMYIGSIEDVDMGDAALRLQNLQTQMQISYSMIAQVKDLSLVKFLT